jgi:hypothetical protein
MANPFSTDEKELVSITSSIEVESNVANGILGAQETGEQQFVEFCNNNLLCEKSDIFQKLKKNKLRTFVAKKHSMKDCKGQQIAVKSTRDFFARLLIISKTREINLKELLSYSLCDYPLALSTVSGSLVKTAKAKMLELLEDMACNPVVEREHVEQNNALIVDAMAILQCMKGKWKTFEEFAESTFLYLVNLAHKWGASRIDFVADRYPQQSIKNAERSKRATQGVQKIHILRKEQNLPKQWKKYLSDGENKESLVAFLCDCWSGYDTGKLGILECMYVTSKSECFLLAPAVSPNDQVLRHEVAELQCDHEEADTCLLLHSKHAANTYDRIIIKSPDTDVFILCVAMQNIIGKNLFMMTGSGNKFRLIDISDVATELGNELCTCLPGFHAFSGK